MATLNGVNRIAEKLIGQPE